MMNFRPCPNKHLQVVGTAVALVISLIFLLTFLAWRIVKLCCPCCKCVRGPQRVGKRARVLIDGRGTRVLKVLILGAAIGVLAGALYGVFQVGREVMGRGAESLQWDGSSEEVGAAPEAAAGPSSHCLLLCAHLPLAVCPQVEADLVGAGFDAVDCLTGFVDSAVTAAQGTITATQSLDEQLLLIKADMEALGPLATATVAPYIDVGAGGREQLVAWLLGAALHA